jgi:hypothetical protein
MKSYRFLMPSSMSFFLLLVTAVIILLPRVAGAQVYLYGRTGFLTGGGPSAIALGDFNGDNRLDLAVTNSADNTVSILLGASRGTFKPTSIMPLVTCRSES